MSSPPPSPRAAPRVSVVVPAYNVESWVGQAIASVLAQTEPSLELLLIDDGSTDATRDVIRSINDSRIRLVENERNRGVSAARNLAISQARGEWIALLDADDWWAPQRLERLLGETSRANSTMVADDLCLIEDGATRPWGRLFGVRGLQIDSPRLIGAAEFVRVDLGLTKPIIKRDFLARSGIVFGEENEPVEDFAFCVDCLLAGATLLVVPDSYCFYRARKNAVTSDRVRVSNGASVTADRLAQDTRVIHNPELRLAVAQYGRRARSGKRYFEFIQLVKAGRIVRAALMAARSPDVTVQAARHLPWSLRARLSRSR
ncbi:MAG: glycosyltransferase family 2 protein [Isosphaeraceae bacterium]|nr:glycosyltransferase family 2 protein [Isosphaeraceae bacterium]